jgi:hypothetical protein
MKPARPGIIGSALFTIIVLANAPAEAEIKYESLCLSQNYAAMGIGLSGARKNWARHVEEKEGAQWSDIRVAKNYFYACEEEGAKNRRCKVRALPCRSGLVLRPRN